MSNLRPLIGVINLSTNISNSDVIKMVVAIQEQLKSDVAPAWGRDYWFVMFFANPKALSPRAKPIVIVDNDSTAYALGWHAERNGRPYGKIVTDPILKNGGTILYDPKNPQNVTVSSVLSHEIIETFIDPNVQIWVDGPPTMQGSCYAMEVCDPVENNFYVNTAAGSAVSLSNFVLPSYFDEYADGKFDFLNILNAPFSSAPGGYMTVRKEFGGEVEIFNEKLPDKWKIEIKNHKLSSRNTQRKSLPRKINCGSVFSGFIYMD